MHHLIETLSSLVRSPLPSRLIASEPLDHPCLVSAPHGLIDDLPLPAFSVADDGAISILAER
jgi:hypothetical protein